MGRTLLKSPANHITNGGVVCKKGKLLLRPNTIGLCSLSIHPTCPVLVCRSQRLVREPSNTSSVSQSVLSLLRVIAVSSTRVPPGNFRPLPLRRRVLRSPKTL